MRFRAGSLVLAFVLAACSAQNGVTGLNSGLNQKQSKPGIIFGSLLYVADTASNAVDFFQSTDNGNVAPSGFLSGSNTGLSSPNGVAVASDGTIYVANDVSGGSITVYAPGSNGNMAPTRTLTCGGLAHPGGMSLDPIGNLYVANVNGKSISVFGPADSGCVSGNRVITGVHTCLFSPQDVDVRADGTLYVASSSAVLVFAPGASGDATPIQKITGSNTLLLPRVMGVSIDSVNNIYATSYSLHKKGRVTVFAPAANGNVAPLYSIAGSATTLDVVDKIELDSSDQAFVTNDAAVDVFATGAMGNVPPTQAITGPATTLVSPAGLDLNP